MTEKCEICEEEIERTFLDKINGTIVKVEAKKVFVCGNCQKKFKDKLVDELKKNSG